MKTLEEKLNNNYALFRSYAKEYFGYCYNLKISEFKEKNNIEEIPSEVKKNFRKEIEDKLSKDPDVNYLLELACTLKGNRKAEDILKYYYNENGIPDPSNHKEMEIKELIGIEEDVKETGITQQDIVGVIPGISDDFEK